MSEQKKNKKGFIQSLKEDPKTLEEAKEKTKNFFILLSAIAVVFVVALSFLHILIGVIVLIGSAGAYAYLYFKEDQKNKRNFCPDCGAMIDYEAGVAWEVVKYDEKSYSYDSSKEGRQMLKKRIATVRFTCTCVNCGNTREFHENYTVVRWYSDGTVEKDNIETLAKGYFYSR